MIFAARQAGIEKGCRSPYRRRSPLWRAAATGLLLALFVLPLPAQRSREYDLKAVFLFNFATFVEWPDEDARPPGEPFVIGIWGDNPFGPILQSVVAGETVKGAPLVVRRCTNLEEARQSRILFINVGSSARLAEVLAAVRDRPVLTVAENPQFLEAGGIVRFSTGAHVELHINAEAARRARLNISSKLLRVAKVQGGPAP
jgi:hypothetical protein